MGNDLARGINEFVRFSTPLLEKKQERMANKGAIRLAQIRDYLTEHPEEWERMDADSQAYIAAIERGETPPPPSTPPLPLTRMTMPGEESAAPPAKRGLGSRIARGLATLYSDDVDLSPEQISNVVRSRSALERLGLEAPRKAPAQIEADTAAKFRMKNVAKPTPKLGGFDQETLDSAEQGKWIEQRMPSGEDYKIIAARHGADIKLAEAMENAIKEGERHALELGKTKNGAQDILEIMERGRMPSDTELKALATEAIAGGERAVTWYRLEKAAIVYGRLIPYMNTDASREAAIATWKEYLQRSNMSERELRLVFKLAEGKAAAGSDGFGASSTATDATPLSGAASGMDFGQFFE